MRRNITKNLSVLLLMMSVLTLGAVGCDFFKTKPSRMPASKHAPGTAVEKAGKESPPDGGVTAECGDNGKIRYCKDGTNCIHCSPPGKPQKTAEIAKCNWYRKHYTKTLPQCEDKKG